MYSFWRLILALIVHSTTFAHTIFPLLIYIKMIKRFTHKHRLSNVFLKETKYIQLKVEKFIKRVRQGKARQHQRTYNYYTLI